MFNSQQHMIVRDFNIPSQIFAWSSQMVPVKWSQSVNNHGCVHHLRIFTFGEGFP